MANQEIITLAVDLNGLTTNSTTDLVLISTQSFETDIALVGPTANQIESDSIPMAIALR
jgi:hypothetical protein